MVIQASPRLGRLLRWRYCCLVAALAVAGVPHSAFAATRTITEADNGKSIQLNVQDTLTVRLKSNETTGYTWSVLPVSTTCLKLQSQDDVGTPNSPTGAGGKHIFIFQAVSPGKGVLTLHYVRSWEKPDPNETRFTVNVTIQ
jgi:predicted secreted protein